MINNASKLDEAEIKKILQQINVEDWTSLGYTHIQLINMIRRHPALLSYDINIIKEKLDFMMSLWNSKEGILEMTSIHPQIFDYTTENLTKTIEKVVDFGFEKEQALKFLLRVCSFILPEEFIEKKFNQLISIGYNKDEIIKMLETFPSLFLLNIDVLNEKIQFYDRIGLSKKVAENAKLLMQSTELSYARYMFYKSIGITIDEENFKLLFMSGKDFQELYHVNNRYIVEKYGKSTTSEHTENSKKSISA